MLLDVEGTTTAIAFVRETLYGYASEQLEGFLREQSEDPELVGVVAALRREHAAADDPSVPPWPAGDADQLGRAAAYARWLMARDRKSTPLKALQGRIWKAGYESGELRGHVYPEVPGALRRWRKEGRQVAIFSSGSVLAQRMLFSHSTAGDLSPLIDAYFDTETGPKKEAGSYRAIAARLGIDPSRVLFISDSVEELDAAARSGMRTRLSDHCEEEVGALPQTEPAARMDHVEEPGGNGWWKRQATPPSSRRRAGRA